MNAKARKFSALVLSISLSLGLAAAAFSREGPGPVVSPVQQSDQAATVNQARLLRGTPCPISLGSAALVFRRF